MLSLALVCNIKHAYADAIDSHIHSQDLAFDLDCDEDKAECPVGYEIIDRNSFQQKIDFNKSSVFWRNTDNFVYNDNEVRSNKIFSDYIVSEGVSLVGTIIKNE